MIFYEKHVGETPLEMLERLRRERPELVGETLSYAGRLDPMAEGAMLVLVGEENKDRERYLSYDKEYEATFLVGVSTDSGDILGLIDQSSKYFLEDREIQEVLGRIQATREQVYPWFSGKTVKGRKLFDYFRQGDTDIERPRLNIVVNSIELLSTEKIDKDAVGQYVEGAVGKVEGDFRQKEVLEHWHMFLQKSKRTHFQLITLRLVVSSGTFIRAFTDIFEAPTLLFRLVRTKIVTDKTEIA